MATGLAATTAYGLCGEKYYKFWGNQSKLPIGRGSATPRRYYVSRDTYINK